MVVATMGEGYGTHNHNTVMLNIIYSSIAAILLYLTQLIEPMANVLQNLISHYNHLYQQTHQQLLPFTTQAHDYIQQHITPYIEHTIHYLTYHSSHLDPLLNSIISVLIISIVPFITISIIVLCSKLINSSSRHLLTDNTLKILVAFAVGGLLGDAFLHLVPHSLNKHSHTRTHTNNLIQYKPHHELLTTDDVLNHIRHHTSAVYDTTAQYTSGAIDLTSQYTAHAYDLASTHGTTAYNILNENANALYEAAQYHGVNTVESLKPHINTLYDKMYEKYNEIITPKQSGNNHVTPSQHQQYDDHVTHDSVTVEKDGQIVHVEADLEPIRAPHRRLLQHNELNNNHNDHVHDDIIKYQQQRLQAKYTADQQGEPLDEREFHAHTIPATADTIPHTLHVEPQIQVVPVVTDNIPIIQPVEPIMPYVEPQAQIVPIPNTNFVLQGTIKPLTHTHTHHRSHAITNNDIQPGTATKHWDNAEPGVAHAYNQQPTQQHGHDKNNHPHNYDDHEHHHLNHVASSAPAKSQQSSDTHSHDDTHEHNQSILVGLQILSGMFIFFILEKLARLRNNTTTHGHSHSHDNKSSDQHTNICTK